jgi:hypothetical protein
VRAWLNLRHNVPERIEAFTAGLKRLGYGVEHQLTMEPEAGDVMLSWNRFGQNDRVAEEFERRGCTVLIAENAYTGNEFAGARWYALGRSQHNGAGTWSVGGPERWDSLGVELEPWREGGDEIVILPQRGMGPPGVAMPSHWTAQAVRACGGRIRPHPGTRRCVPLRDDLARARCVWTWGSGAAIKALLWGIPAHSDFRQWIGKQDNTDAGRLAMFRRLIWAQATLAEIASGEALARVLQ